MTKLMIVESPHKSITIKGFLDNDFKVLASQGHIRDLATSGKFGLGVDVESDFAPSYINMKGKSKIITTLKKEVKEADHIYLASDPDREGEAIAWHLKDALNIPENKYSRVTFNEITKEVVKEGLANERKIDMDLVDSQETRRILDRIIGFRLSKLMMAKVAGAKSAGRVQSVALLLIVEKERRILAFIPKEYWEIVAKFDGFDAKLEKYNNKKIEINTKEEADNIVNSLDENYLIKSVDKKLAKHQSKPVFKTTTMQQLASSKLNFSSSKTMQIAQRLYEGINIGKDTVGLITYMRTDAERVSKEFITETYKYIEDNYGKDYLGQVKIPKTNQNAQDAHEGIRPTSIMRTPDSIKGYLSDDEYKLYSMIYYRALSSLMAPQVVEQTQVSLLNNNYEFKANGSVLKFDGYLKVYSKYEDQTDTVLPNTLKENETIKSNEVESTKHATKPEGRYTEASLIKELESLGIGRPSTYATIIKTLKDRDYVKIEKKSFIPTEIGIKEIDKLLSEFGSSNHSFKNIINVKYTANMEDELDKISEGKLNKVEVLKDFYNEFEPLVEEAFKEMKGEEVVKTDTLCPKCNKHNLVIRNGKNGKFFACEGYPDCDYTKSLEEPKTITTKDENGEDVEETCPNCGSALVEKRSRYGKFIACSNYPQCKYIKGDEKKAKEPLKEIMDCPVCKKGKIVERKATRGKNKGNTFYGCSAYPRCKAVFDSIPSTKPCPKCESVMVIKNEKRVCTSCKYEEDNI